VLYVTDRAVPGQGQLPMEVLESPSLSSAQTGRSRPESSSVTPSNGPFRMDGRRSDQSATDYLVMLVDKAIKISTQPSGRD
jgi:hypothetical protein